MSGRLRAVGFGGLLVSPVYAVGWVVARPPVWGLALQAAWAAVCVVFVLSPWRWRRRRPAPANGYQAAIINSRPVAYWPLNEAQPRRRRWWRR